MYCWHCNNHTMSFCVCDVNLLISTYQHYYFLNVFLFQQIQFQWKSLGKSCVIRMFEIWFWDLNKFSADRIPCSPNSDPRSGATAVVVSQVFRSGFPKQPRSVFVDNPCVQNVQVGLDFDSAEIRLVCPFSLNTINLTGETVERSSFLFQNRNGQWILQRWDGPWRPVVFFLEIWIWGCLHWFVATDFPVRRAKLRMDSWAFCQGQFQVNRNASGTVEFIRPQLFLSENVCGQLRFFRACSTSMVEKPWVNSSNAWSLMDFGCFDEWPRWCSSPLERVGVVQLEAEWAPTCGGLAS